MSLPVIVTRAQPGADETAARLRAAGYKPILSPALVLEPLSTDLDLSGVTDLVFTSANGVRHFPAVSDSVQRVWCVGEATAEAARKAGWRGVREGNGNAVDLAEHIIAAPEARTGVFLHIANEGAAGDLIARLTAAGVNARFAALYRTLPVSAVADGAASALTRAARAVILVHSAKGAAAFRNAARGLDLRRSIVVAISEAASKPLVGCGAKAVVNAAQPSETALMEALDTAVLAL